MKKRLFSLLIAAAMCFSITGTALADLDITVGDDGSAVDMTRPEKPEKPDPPDPEKPGTNDRDDDDDDDDNGYAISLSGQSTKGGKVEFDTRNAEAGDTVTITVTPDDGYELSKLIIRDARGRIIDYKDLGNGKYSFVMPSSRVSVQAIFVKTGTAAPSFTDVPSSAYYYAAVQWAVANGITTGKTATTFAPNDPCTRAQIVTFLWRASGSPAPTTTTNPFTDVPAGSYFYNAVLWAVEKGITTGTTATTFSPNNTCTRGQAVTFIHRMEGKPAATAVGNFTDVAEGQYYYDAVQWAVEKGVTAGVSLTQFAPNRTCTRAQIVTFLYRDMANAE